MSSHPPIRFSHSHHLLSVKGCASELDVLAFEGDEALSTPFRYRIEFTSGDHGISKEMMLMKAASLTLQAPVDQGYGIKVQQAVRVIQGVVSGFERLSTSKDETHYALTLTPRLALLSRSHQNAIYQDMSVPQIVEKILRERHSMRGQDFLFSLTQEYPRREQVMQYGEDDLHFITRLLGEAGIPDSTDFSFRPEPGSRPVMAGTLPARVTSTTENDTYGHIDKDGRYRVNMLFDRDNWETGFESLWVRQSRPYAGDTYGLHLPLLAGTEVAIGFEDGNPDRPYIAGVLHDSAHGDHVTIRNYKRNVLRTPANNKIRLDDERGKEHIKVSTEYGGKSQLNLGHLVDAEKQKRGEGFELRTDSWGAIRAQKGIFITADGQAQAQAQGPVLEMGAALSQLQLALSQAEALSGAVETAKAELADIQTQKALLQQTLTDLKQSALLLSAPEGIAQSTPKSVQLSAGENVISTSGKHTDFSALKRFTVAAGERISLFAQKLGIKIFASKGKVEIQAQGDEMTLDALKDIRISSSEGRLIISAKQEIILTSGGGYIRIADGMVECAAPDKIIQRAAVWQKFGGQSMSQAAQSWESSEFEMGPEVLWPYSDKPVVGQKISLTHSDGTVQELMTSASGRGEKQNVIDPASMQINLKDED